MFAWVNQIDVRVPGIWIIALKKFSSWVCVCNTLCIFCARTWHQKQEQNLVKFQPPAIKMICFLKMKLFWTTLRDWIGRGWSGEIRSWPQSGCSSATLTEYSTNVERINDVITISYKLISIKTEFSNGNFLKCTKGNWANNLISWVKKEKNDGNSTKLQVSQREVSKKFPLSKF